MIKQEHTANHRSVSLRRSPPVRRAGSNMLWRACADCKGITLRWVDMNTGPACEKCWCRLILGKQNSDKVLLGFREYQCVSCDCQVPVLLQLFFAHMAACQCVSCWKHAEANRGQMMPRVGDTSESYVDCDVELEQAVDDEDNTHKIEQEEEKHEN